MPEPRQSEVAVMWSCMACGTVGHAQSCAACGAEAMPGEWVPKDHVERLLSEVSRDYAGAHVNAGVVVGTVRKRLRELL